MGRKSLFYKENLFILTLFEKRRARENVCLKHFQEEKCMKMQQHICCNRNACGVQLKSHQEEDKPLQLAGWGPGKVS